MQPSFTVYVTGGMEPFYDTLNAVAMFFNDGELIWDVALMGGMLAVLSGAWYYTQKIGGSNMIRANSWIEHGVMMAVALAIGFAPCRITIQDIYGDQNAVPVDNVPLILGAPAAIFSGIGYYAFEAIDTVFSGVSGSYMSVSDQGFATPLSLLFAMRGGLQSVAPDMSRSMQSYMLNCSRNSAINSQGITTSTNLFDYLLQNGRDEGLTETYIALGGGNTVTPLNTAEIVSCSEAKDRLRIRFDIFETGGMGGAAGVDRLINNNVKQAQSGAGAGGTASYTYADYQNSFNQLLGFTGQSAQNFMRTALIRNLAIDTYRCTNASFSAYAFTNCTQLQSDAMEAYKIDSAAGASLFTKTMLPAMILLQMLFFSFGIMIFLYGLLRGAAVVNYLGKYMLFGMWVFSWLPFVAIINAFIQWMVIDKISQLPIAGLNSENYGTYMYDVLSTNLATASDMLAATPLLTLGLLTGSAYAIAGVAGRLSAKDYVDESQAAPRTGTVQPLVQTTPQHQSNAITGVQSSDHVDPVFSVSNATRAAAESAHAQSVSSQISQMRAAERAVGAMVQDVGGGQWTSIDGRGHSLGQMNALGEAQRVAISKANESGLSTDVTAQIKGFFGALGSGAGISEAYKNVQSSSAREAIDKGLDSGTKYSDDYVSKAEDVYSQRGGTLSADSRSARDAYTDQKSKTTQDVESYRESLTRSQDSSMRRDLPAATLGRAIMEDATAGGGGQYARRIGDEYRELQQERGGAAEAAYQESLRYLTSNGKTVLPGQEEMAQMMAVERLSPNSGLQDRIVAEVAAVPAIQGSAYENSGIGDSARGITVSDSNLGAHVPSAVAITGAASGFGSGVELQDRVAHLDSVQAGGVGTQTQMDNLRDNYRKRVDDAGGGNGNLDSMDAASAQAQADFLKNEQINRIENRGNVLADNGGNSSSAAVASAVHGAAQDTAMTALTSGAAVGNARADAAREKFGQDISEGRPPEIYIPKAEHGENGEIIYYKKP